MFRAKCGLLPALALATLVVAVVAGANSSAEPTKIFSIDNIVSYTSRYVTLEPGDVIFTGTPGTTQAMKPGDTYEVEIPGVTLLRNKVVQGK